MTPAFELPVPSTLNWSQLNNHDWCDSDQLTPADHTDRSRPWVARPPSEWRWCRLGSPSACGPPRNAASPPDWRHQSAPRGPPPANRGQGVMPVAHQTDAINPLHVVHTWQQRSKLAELISWKLRYLRYILGLFGYFFPGGSPTCFGLGKGPITPTGPPMVRTDRKDSIQTKQSILRRSCNGPNGPTGPKFKQNKKIWHVSDSYSCGGYEPELGCKVGLCKLVENYSHERRNMVQRNT